MATLHLNGVLTVQRGSTLILKAAVAIVGLIALAICVAVSPAALGRVDAEGYRPVLLLMYITAVPFWFALYQIWRLLYFIDKNKAFSGLSVAVLGRIKICALIISGLYTLGLPYIYQVADKDDAPGVVVLGLLAVGGSFLVATFAAVLQRLLQNAITIKKENDLTV